MVGVIPTDEALRQAREAGLDLVEVSPNERPPVCRIMDYGKHKYQQSKRLKQKHHEQRLKEVRLRPKTDPHDKSIKLRRAITFLEQGDKVQFTMLFRGRERFHKEVGLATFNEIVKDLEEIAKVDMAPRAMGRRMTMVLVPLKAPSPHKSSQPKKASSPKEKPVPAKSEAATPEVAHPEEAVPEEAAALKPADNPAGE